MSSTMKAPFPWFGGKSRAAPLIWERFGAVDNYVEPFAGSLAVLLGAPKIHTYETVNDADGFVANFWRALAADPDELARWADWPVNEVDLHARHVWLVERRMALTDRLMGDPDYYDVKIAGWWVWGLCCWIAGGWCSGKGPWGSVDGVFQKTDGGGVNRKPPHLGNAGKGVHRQRPHIGYHQCINRAGNDGSLQSYMRQLHDRLDRVRVCCGDWSRVCGPTPTTKLGITAVLLDPPYSAEADRRMDCYSVDSGTVAHEVRQWCVDRGDDPKIRIALCGYEGEHEALEDLGWSVVAWKTQGGYGSRGGGRGLENSTRERIWFSPHCQAQGSNNAQQKLF